MKKRLKKSEYPKNVACLAQNCLSCPALSSSMKYSDCPNLQWKTDNRGKYQVEVTNGRISNVYLTEE